MPSSIRTTPEKDEAALKDDGSPAFSTIHMRLRSAQSTLVGMRRPLPQPFRMPAQMIFHERRDEIIAVIIARLQPQGQVDPRR